MLPNLIWAFIGFPLLIAIGFVDVYLPIDSTSLAFIGPIQTNVGVMLAIDLVQAIIIIGLYKCLND